MTIMKGWLRIHKALLAVFAACIAFHAALYFLVVSPRRNRMEYLEQSIGGL